MKKILISMGLMFSFGLVPFRISAQVYELERLILDIEKLLQLKNVLSDLYKDFEILESGYSAIKNISEGNFNLHKIFLDGLLVVSPTVQKYQRIVDIAEDQEKIVSEYKSAYHLFEVDKHFTADELIYMSTVYNNLVSKSEKNLEDLLNVVTAGKLRMSDAERLRAIDEIYLDTHGQLMFLRQFNAKTSSLGTERARQANDLESIRSLYGGD